MASRSPDGKGVQCGPLLVVAGPGTGKTETIAHRTALGLRCTGRSGAHHAADFYAPRRGPDAPARARHHAPGARRHARQQGPRRCCSDWCGPARSTRSATGCCAITGGTSTSSRRFSVIDRSDSADLFDTLRQELKLGEQHQRFPRKDTCLAIYSWRINTQKSLRETLEQQFPVVPELGAGSRQALSRLRRAQAELGGLLDYDDLLVYWQAMMNEPRLAQQVAANFDHVLVDEYQDTNKPPGRIVHAPEAHRRRSHRGGR